MRALLSPMARICRPNPVPEHMMKLIAVWILLIAETNAFSPSNRIGYRYLPTTRHLPFTSTPAVKRRPQKWTTRLHTATSITASTPSGPTVKKSLVSASLLVILDVLFRRLFQALSISFPSSLAGCGVLFASLLTLPFGDKLYNALSPGSALLAKWLPVFFVPSLITLPLADGLGSPVEFGKVALVIIGGFYFTLVTTAISVLAIRDALSPKDKLPATAPPLEEINEDKEDNTDEATKEMSDIVEEEKAPQAEPFSLELVQNLRSVNIASAIAATAAYRLPALAQLETPLTTAFLLFSTFYSFVFGARLPKRFTKIVHPLVTCTTGTWLFAKLFGIVNGISFPMMLRKYKTGKLALTGAGAGDILLFLLGPAVVSLACQMYDRRKLIRENFAEVATAVLVSSFGGLFGTAFAVRALLIGNPSVRLSLLSRNITSPLAMAIASILGGDVSLAVSMVVVTGLIGANFGATILDALGITDAVARGMGIGAAAHGLGTAAFANEEDAFPFAAIAMALTASACTVLVSIPVIKKAVLQIALGW